MTAYSVSWRESEKEISAQLWQTCFAPPVEGRFWYEALEKSHLESQFKFAYAVILKDGAEVGIMPTFLMDVPIELVAPPEAAKIIRVVGGILPSLLYQRTLFIGSPCSDEGTVGLLPGIKFACLAPSLQAAVEQRAAKLKAPMIVWKDFPDSYSDDLKNLSRQAGMFVLTSYPGTMLELPDRNKQTYFAQLKGSRRHNLKKKLKRSGQNFRADVEVYCKPDSTVLDEAFALFWQTYEKGTTKFEKLNREFFSHVAKNELAYFIVVRNAQDNKMVAFMLCFNLGERVINKFIGIDYRLPGDWFLYFRLWDAALDWVLTTSAREFQSGQTGYRAKIDVGNSLVALTNYCKHRNPIIHKIFALATRDVSWRTLDDDLAVFLKAHPPEPPEPPDPKLPPAVPTK